LSSQCEAILARSILPCQDSPSRKSTYKAKVRLTDRFGKYSVLMSALRVSAKGNTFTFNQPQPIPTYLLAIAVGEFYSAKITP
jgi:leukotriene-A4 hydrolase